MEVFTGLLHDASADLPAHRARQQQRYARAIGPLVVPEDRLSALGDADGEVAVSVRSGTGAGGLLALARRRTGFRVVAVETVLRDLTDLAQNAARVVAAAHTLPDGIEVYVEVPGSAGFVEAVETIEAGGLFGRVDLAAVSAGPGSSAAERLSVLVEADLACKVTALSPTTFGHHGVAAVLMAVEALIDGADADEATALLVATDPARMRAGLAGWDTATQSRVRRRLHGVDCLDLGRALEELGRAGLLASAGADDA